MGDRRMGVEEEAMSKRTNPAKRINSEGKEKDVGLKQITRDRSSRGSDASTIGESAAPKLSKLSCAMRRSSGVR